MTKPVFMQIFDCSTAHVNKDSLDYLSGYSRFEDEYGYLISTETLHNEPPPPEEVSAILLYAMEIGSNYVMFDRDGQIYDQFPQFDW